MRLTVLEPFRQPPVPTGGHIFDDLTMDSVADKIRQWKLTGRTMFKIEDSPDRWMTFDSQGSDEFEAAFQSSPESWQRVIGTKFNAEGCCHLASRFFSGDESMLYRYPLDTRPAAKKLTDEELRRVQVFQESLATRKWWQFWK
jgi:hypothetical protein